MILYKKAISLFFSIICLLCPQEKPIKRGSREFFNAIINGNIAKVKECVQEEGHSITFSLDFDRYCKKKPLHIAAMVGNLDIVKFLIEEAQADIHIIDEIFYQTPLGYAAEYDQKHIIKYLLSKGANILGNPEKKSDDTPFETAIKSNKLNAVKCLKRLGADIHHDQERALYKACSTKNIQVIHYLLQQGLSLKNRFDKRLSFIGRAFLGKHHDTVIYLLKQGANIHDDLWLEDDSRPPLLRTQNDYLGFEESLESQRKLRAYIKKIKEFDDSTNQIDFFEQAATQNNRSQKKFINVLLPRAVYVLGNETEYYNFCLALLKRCKKNKTLAKKVKQYLDITQLQEKKFFKAIVKKIKKDCYDINKTQKIAAICNMSNFRKNLLRSRANTDIRITTYTH